MTAIEDAIDDLFNNPQLPADEAIDQHSSLTFRQRTNGNWAESFFVRGHI